MKSIHTTPEFQDIPEDEVFEALNDENPANPIAVEVARLIEGYMSNFQKHVEKLGHMPQSILRSSGSCPIESIAMRLVSETIRDTLEDKA